MRDDTPQEKRDKKSVGQKIQRFRDEMGLSQLQMAERMGPKYNRKSVSKYENGSDHMRIGALFTLCDIFGVSLEELGPDRLLSDQNKLLEDYRSLNLKNREMFKSFLDYLKSRQAADTGEDGDTDQRNTDTPEEAADGQTPESEGEENV